MFRVSEAEIRRRLTDVRRRFRERGPTALVNTTSDAASAWNPNDTINPYERELLELLVIYPETWSAALALRCRRTSWRRPRCGGFYETGCRLLDESVPPDFDRLILAFDDPSLKSLLVDLDEQGRAKGSRMAEPPELLNDLLKSLERKEMEKQRPSQLATLREHRLDDAQEIDLLKNILQQERSRQGISEPTDG